jgi:hypothetical protein
MLSAAGCLLEACWNHWVHAEQLELEVMTQQQQLQELEQ